MTALFLCHRRDRWVDSWTYGDWRQWICNRPAGGKGDTQCARIVFPLPCGWALMLTVGPMNNGTRRVFPGEDSA